MTDSQIITQGRITMFLFFLFARTIVIVRATNKIVPGQKKMIWKFFLLDYICGTVCWVDLGPKLMLYIYCFLVTTLDKCINL